MFSEWGSPIGLSIANGIDPNQDVLRVDVPDVPQNACAQLATYDFTNNRLAVNGNVAYNITSAGGTISPINVATVTANCSNPLNDISIWFGKDN